jgi:hypothetical protein
MRGDANGAGLIRDRASDRLAYPPGCIGRKLVAAAIFELIDRFHQADIALLDQVEELQATIGVFFSDRDDEAQISLHHLFLGLARFALTLLHHMHDPAKLADFEPGLACEDLDIVAVLLDLVFVSGDQVPPAPGGKLRDPIEPARIKLGAAIVLEEILECHAVTLGEPHQFALVTEKPFIDVVDLLDQRIDAGLLQSERLHRGDDVALEPLVAAFLRGRRTRCPPPGRR